MGMGSDSGSQATSTAQSEAQVPSYVQPYIEQGLGRAYALTDIAQNPYQPYAGSRVAEFGPLQNQAFSQLGSLQRPQQFAMGTELAQKGGQGMLSTTAPAMEYGAKGARYGDVGATYGQTASLAGQRYAEQATNAADMSRYMSPYMTNVVDWQKEQAIRDFAKQTPALQAKAVGQGAFGGSRSAIAQSEAQRALMNQLTGIEATGQQAAFEKAQQAQQFGANLGLQGLQAGMQGAGLGMQGAGLGLQGVGTAQAGYGGATQAGGTLGNIGQQQGQFDLSRLSLMLQAGKDQQARNQALLDVPYQNYVSQMNYPYQQLAFMQGMYQGLPLSQTAQTMYQAQPSYGQQALGYGLGALGAYKAFGP